MTSPTHLAYLEQRERDREARARAPVGWLVNYNDGADDAVRGLIAPILTDEELALISRQHRRFERSKP